MPEEKSIEQYQHELVESMKQRGAIQRHDVERAFRAIPRHLFLPNVPLERAYSDRAIPLKHDAGGLVVSSSSQPTMMSVMLHQMDPHPGQNILEIGTASGYNAALLKHIIGDGGVTTVELDEDLVRQAEHNLWVSPVADVHVVHGDGAEGYAPHAPYDSIVSTVGVWDIPATWWHQLKPSGRLVVPLVLDGMQVSATFHPQADGTFLSSANHPCAFVYLRGNAAGPDFRRQVASTSLYILADQVSRIDTASLHLLLSDDHQYCDLDRPMAERDFWFAFQLYLMLDAPQEFVFAVYSIIENRQAYGMEGAGFALFAPGSAAFAGYGDRGRIHCFAGADAFLEMQTALDHWIDLGQPDMRALRVRMIPKALGKPPVQSGRLFERSEHYLHAWLAD